MNTDEPDTDDGARLTPAKESLASPGRSTLVRVRLDLSYDGAGFAGWALQPGQRTVQGVLTEALTVLLPQCGALTVAGRTDAGVHAIGQVAHVDIAADAWTGIGNLRAKLSGLLPYDVRVREVREVPAAFDARFGALWRRYCYRISDAPWGVEPLRRTDTLHWPRAVDDRAMHRAGQGLLGTHDFAAYCRARVAGTTIRELQHLRVTRSGDVVEARVQADAFCHCMVRSVVGALLAVGDGRRSPDWPAALLALPARAGDVQVAPALGLTLFEVGYPPDDGLAKRMKITRATRAPVERTS
ncbi:MAG: tRNA pseudouridine(38-40) synthase TruA [Geodermatophilaceae bacterium]|nr:tRNA pseudouridine(38-40) synthase TruA [Geodermatophilaceae bacterium]